MIMAQLNKMALKPNPPSRGLVDPQLMEWVKQAFETGALRLGEKLPEQKSGGGAGNQSEITIGGT